MSNDPTDGAVPPEVMGFQVTAPETVPALAPPEKPQITYRATLHDGDIRRTVELAERIRRKFAREYAHGKYPLLAAALGQCFSLIGSLCSSNGIALKVSPTGLSWSHKVPEQPNERG